MEEKNFIDRFKDFYYKRNGKAILFFGFYLIFFLALILFLKKEEKVNVDENKVGKSLTINELVNLNDYEYSFEIKDEDNTLYYKGTKNNIDYHDFNYSYFFDPVNINQLVKKSKVKEDNVYEISNEIINSLLDTERESGNNTIMVHSNEERIVLDLDLHEYMNKNVYLMSLSYQRSANE